MQHIFSSLAIALCLFIPWQSISQCNFPSIPDGIDCNEARYVCGYELDGFTAKLPDTLLSQNYPAPFCPNGGNVDNMYWLSFFVCQEQVILNIIPDNCTSGEDNLEGIQVTMYDDCSYANAVYCQVGGAKDPFVVVIGDLIPGSLYYLLLDGNGGSVCDFTIDVIDGIDTDPVVLVTESETGGSDTEISGPAENCAGSAASYSFNAPVCYGVGSNSNCPYLNLHDDGFLCYEWTISPNTGFVITGDPSSEDISIEWLAAGTYQIEVQSYINPSFANCLEPGSSCGNIEILDVTVLDQVIEVEPTMYICEGECIDFCGISYCDAGVYFCDQGNDPCVLRQLTIEKLTADTTDLGPLPLCASGCFSEFDTILCLPGEYLIQDPDDCSAFYSFELFSTGVQIDMPVNSELNCAITQIEIDPQIQNPNGQTLTTYWLNSVGDTIAFDKLIAIDVPDTYTFGVILNSFSDCVIESEIDISENTIPPFCDWEIPALNCAVPEAIITINNNPSIGSISWTGPNGFQSIEKEPMVTEGGLYMIEITGVNGCVTQDTIEIDEDKTPLMASLQYDPIDCAHPGSTPNITTQQQIISYLWSGPSNYISIDESPTMFQAGWYTIELIASNGCTWMEDFEIEDISIAPVITMQANHFWNCNTNSIDIQADILTSGTPDILWTTDDGLIIGSNKNASIEAGSMGIYYLQVKDTLNGCTNQDTVFVIENPDKPNALDIELRTPVCFGEENGMILINEIIGGQAPYKIYINGEIDNGTGIINLLSPGVYDLEIIDAFGCVHQESVTVDEGPDIELTLESAIAIEKNEEAEIILEHNLDPNDIHSIEWFDDSGKLIGSGDILQYTFPYSMQVRALLTHITGCTDEAVITIRIEEIDLGIYVPNIFSPNNDGINDYFSIYADETVNKIEDMLIFDRWGSVVFRQTDFYPNDELLGWNGLYKGIKSSPGTYLYLIILEDKNGEKHEISGEINLIR